MEGPGGLTACHTTVALEEYTRESRNQCARLDLWTLSRLDANSVGAYLCGVVFSTPVDAVDTFGVDEPGSVISEERRPRVAGSHASDAWDGLHRPRLLHIKHTTPTHIRMITSS